MNEMRLAACFGKEAFESAALAHQVQRRRAKSGSHRAESRRDQEAYRCRHCSLWHIGKRTKGVDVQKRRKFYEERNNRISGHENG